MKRAFSLFELSIVLIVVSIILAVIFNMRNFVSNYEIKHIMSELDEYKNSFKSFYQIYNDIPGDMNRGYKLFGGSHCTNHTNNVANNTGCNGNKNHYMDYDSNRNNTDARETILAWYHLYKAEFISFNNNNDMNFNNKNASEDEVMQCGAIVQNIGYNVPALKIRDAGILITKLNMIENDYKYQISLSLKKGVACSLNNYMGVFRASEMDVIDRKYDNNNLSSGNISTTSNECLQHNIRDEHLYCDLLYQTIISGAI